VSFNIQHIHDSWQLTFADEPAYIHALKMAPESMEAELNSGIWLVAVFPVWSAPARNSVVTAISSAKYFDGRFQLGVRPFDYHEEIVKWWPGIDRPPAAGTTVEDRDVSERREIHISTDHSRLPIWLVLRDGKVIFQGVGPQTKEQLIKLMRAVLASAPHP
jgi:hypothetical protein